MADCNCHRCIKEKNLGSEVGGVFMLLSALQMIECPKCGNKRCPHASDHDLACTRSNEPGQPGSIYWQGKVTMKLHAQIMNLPCNDFHAGSPSEEAQRAYKEGHKRARHDAAELASDADAVIAEAKQIIEELCTRYGHPLLAATLARMA